MSAELSTVRARFALRFRCANCRLAASRELVSPDLGDAPADVEELLESNLLNRQFYPCEACDNPVSTLISVKQLGSDEVFQSDQHEDNPQASIKRTVRKMVPTRALPSAASSLRLGERIGRPAY